MIKTDGLYSVEETKDTLQELKVELRIELEDNADLSEELIDELFSISSVTNTNVVVISLIEPEKSSIWLTPHTLKVNVGDIVVKKLFFEWHFRKH